ncbi:hypothetical protein NXF25_019108 [Crotalus adamanteus]|uniref:Uncharacterized protein n=1 Tax=Crotalus adamanteus TaxID=8729 RepID=A0AAW1B122_CROAD
MPQYKSRCEEVINAIIPLPQKASQLTTRGQTQRRSIKPDSHLTQKLKDELKTDLWFNDNKQLLTCQDELAWKGSKLYLPSTLRIQDLQWRSRSFPHHSGEGGTSFQKARQVVLLGNVIYD